MSPNRILVVNLLIEELFWFIMSILLNLAILHRICKRLRVWVPAVISNNSNNYVDAVQNCYLRDLYRCFADSGSNLTSMTKSIGLSVDRFKFHLQLYNRFSPLSEGKINAKYVIEICLLPSLFFYRIIF